jgi:hypothetical protein
MEKAEIKQNLKNTNTWLRLFIMILFIIFFGAAISIFGLLLLFQIVFSLLTGKSNERVRIFSKRLTSYLYQILVYLSYTSDERPFPFSDWPEE